jgi:hypothetical protein
MADPNKPSAMSLVRGQLISVHFLDTQIASRDDWKQISDDHRVAEVQRVYENAKPHLQKNRRGTKGSNEEAVRDLLINPIFEILGLPWSPGVHHFGKQLDYALYQDQTHFEHAQQLINAGKELDALRLSCAVAEAERWDKEFGQKPQRSDLSDPIFQIEFYLGNARRSEGPRWGVLSNGHTWRLYCGDSDPLRHDFLEVELPQSPLFAQQEAESFKALVYFFCSEALRRGGRLDRIYDAATRHAAAITAELRKQAFGAVELIASGIMRASSASSPQLAYEAALIYLFRLLFILKAEADGLIQKQQLSGEIAERVIHRNRESIGGGEWDGNSLWHELHDIFESIARKYNGHLFDGQPPTSSPASAEVQDHFAPARALLECVTVSNQATGNAIDRLLRVYQPDPNGDIHPVRVDYSTLRVRELGTIYEGLLEWRLEPVSEEQIKAGETKLLGDRRVLRPVQQGDYALVADQSDRKATGSYYTPHYVVEFIGRRVLDPIIQEIEQQQIGDDTSHVIERILSLRVLDPAMGSGHFLVFAVEYLADYVFAQLGKLREQSARSGKVAKKMNLSLPVTASIEHIRSRIAEKCIYGVDRNPLAVELAKLSLWIATATVDVPLSFLNHHLRCGDSLLGIDSNELHHELFAQKLREQVGKSVANLQQISLSSAQSLHDVELKEQNLLVARDQVRRFRMTYDCELATLFGVEKGEEFHDWLDSIDQPLPVKLPLWIQTVEKKAEVFRFFHWELEFPEVWRDAKGQQLDPAAADPKQRPGFDAVLGNPPFVKAKDAFARRAYMTRWATAQKGFHLLVPFFELGFKLLQREGRIGFIVSNGFAKREFGQELVENFFPTITLDEIIDCGGLSFPGHGTPTLILFGRPETPVEGSQTLLTTTLKGDLNTDPEISPLWHSIADHHSEQGYHNDWIAVHQLKQQNFAKHPWNFAVENETTTNQIETVPHTTLRSLLADDIGYGCITRTDDVFIQPRHVLRRAQIELRNIRELGIGEGFRDWSHSDLPLIIFPYDDKLRPFSEQENAQTVAFLLPYRETLENVVMHGTVKKKETKKRWFEYSRLGRAKCKTPRAIAFPEIATHNHAYFDSRKCLFHQTAPVIKLPLIASDSDHYLAIGILNSSVALFWLKQKCFNKGAGKHEERDRFVYAGRKLEAFPVPTACADALSYQMELQRKRDQLKWVAKQRTPSGEAVHWSILRLQTFAHACSRMGEQVAQFRMSGIFELPGEAFDSWYRSLPSYLQPDPSISSGFDAAPELIRLKRLVQTNREVMRQRMIALQEEMDWLAYFIFGLVDEITIRDIPEDPESVGELHVGQRPFELSALNSGPPNDWPTVRKQRWHNRLNALQKNKHLRRIEQLVYKRRWVQPDYEKEFRDAALDWLRDKAEFFLYTTRPNGPLAVQHWSDALWKDKRIQAVANVLSGVASANEFLVFFKAIIEEQSVPSVEAEFKPKHKQLRGPLNIPRERFRYCLDQPGHYYLPATQAHARCDNALPRRGSSSGG